jgi:hypothetical protein
MTIPYDAQKQLWELGVLRLENPNFCTGNLLIQKGY